MCAGLCINYQFKPYFLCVLGIDRCMPNNFNVGMLLNPNSCLVSIEKTHLGLDHPSSVSSAISPALKHRSGNRAVEIIVDGLKDSVVHP